MPPKAKITRDMVIDAALAVVRESGVENVNARSVAKKLNCSTQPVMYHFAQIQDLKKAAYTKADQYHTEYLMNREKPQEDMLLGIGLNYIRFAAREPHLFRLLFQSGLGGESSLPAMIDAKELKPILSAMKEAMGMEMAQTKEIFLTLALVVHGYASMIVNSSLEYEEGTIISHLEQVYLGAVLAVQEGGAAKADGLLQRGQRHFASEKEGCYEETI